MAKTQRKRGRPAKAQTLTEIIHARVSTQIKEAVAAFAARELLGDEADAVRELLKIALRKEGLL